ncbi:hypothetical protein JH06_4691 [Blastocystis sp. subtype 4]|uniref:hypothetical protein n=1 Tax=Blastocystis sp. subtype 4 TaxID=944170 RepID=UPI0007121F6E|nr:hypothetical protein JH06_4691 [Blastocystis sp. subtype 4]KNB41860.1 hypothetical protein JH06_4691 [Blastocystis sp. subtype 4]|eukprot:XP_014525303.1 hypothetical protein JH06_4691 [Blastocystis sp. subtype 4]
MATGMYGSAMVYGLMGEVDRPEDVKHLLIGKSDREGYKQAFCDHCHISLDDLLYVNWGCEDDDGESITTSSGLQITPPPYFLVRHHATKSIVLCIRGTWCIKDFISDFKCCGTKWGSGKAHEGIALIANAMLKNEQLNNAITSALSEYPEYRVVAVGHSLGAGIASLITINWRYHRMYNKPVCFAIAPPPILSSSVRDKGVGYVYSFVNEDDLVPRLSKDGIEDALHRITNNCHEKRTWLHHAKKSTVETYQSLFAPSDTLINMYLPGTVYYLHPCIEKYDEYEKRKRRVTDVNKEEKSVIEQVRRMIAKVDGSPGGCVYEKGSNFPNTIIISPMVLIHHFAFNYEKIIKRIDEALDSRSVSVDMAQES